MSEHNPTEGQQEQCDELWIRSELMEPGAPLPLTRAYLERAAHVLRFLYGWWDIYLSYAIAAEDASITKITKIGIWWQRRGSEQRDGFAFVVRHEDGSPGSQKDLEKIVETVAMQLYKKGNDPA